MAAAWGSMLALVLVVLAGWQWCQPARWSGA